MPIITLYRIQKIKHNPTTLTGEGAALTGNRWNYKGTRLVYASATASLAAWEQSVHFGTLPFSAYPPINIAVLELPSELIHVFSEEDLPSGWNDLDSIEVAQKFLAPYLESGDMLAYSVPSVVIPGERNYLINPRHPAIEQVIPLRFIPFKHDRRLR